MPGQKSIYETFLVLLLNGGSVDQITVKTPNPKCRLYSVFNRVYRLEIQSVMLVFSTQGGDSHLEISVIPMLRHLSYTREYSHGARAWQVFVAVR